MAEYPDQNNYVTGVPEDEHNFTIQSKRKNLMREREYSVKRVEHLAREKANLEERRREIIFLMDAEEALLNGTNQALSTMDNFDSETCEASPEGPTEDYSEMKRRGW